MNKSIFLLGMLSIAFLPRSLTYGAPPATPAPNSANSSLKSLEPLQPFQLLIGSWRGSGSPEGTLEERRQGAWQETVSWSWQFQGDKANLAVTFEKGKFYTKGTLRYLPDTKVYQLQLETTDKKAQTFEGALKDKILTVDRVDEASGQSQRLVFSLLHSNRVLYRYETKAKASSLFTKQYQVGCTKEGVAFAETGPSERECVVSGGVGTMAVMHEGKTYYVCCTGCRDAFKENPTKYIREWEARRAGK